MRYNTQRDKLVLPEYGRHVQQMVNYCMTLPEKEQRNECAREIVGILLNMFPDIAHGTDPQASAWDIINIMSGFNLDVDFPCDVTSRDKLKTKPDPVPYGNGHIRFRHYGIIIEKMINRLGDMPDSDEKSELVFLIASHMKKLMTRHNREGAEDFKIFKDLETYSGGRISISPEMCTLADYNVSEEPEQPAAKRKNKNQKRKKGQNKR